MNCQIYILSKQKSLVWVLEIHFWPPKYFERQRIEEKLKKTAKKLDVGHFDNLFAAHYLINRLLDRQFLDLS